MTLTDAELAAIRARAEAAMPGLWDLEGLFEEDKAFLANAVPDMTRLLDTVDALEAALREIANVKRYSRIGAPMVEDLALFRDQVAEIRAIAARALGE